MKKAAQGFEKKVFLQHLLIWLLYIAYELAIVFSVNPSQVNLISTFLAFMINAAVFYTTSYYVLGDATRRSHYLLIGFKLILLLFSYLLVSAFLNNILLPSFNLAENTPVTFSIIAQRIWRGIYFIGLAFGYWMAIKVIASERTLRLIEKQRFEQEIRKSEMEQQVVKAHLESLKYQINPHFLHNTLNFFYSQVYPLSQDLAHAILLLSDIMRYALIETMDGKAELEGEVTHLQNYIELNRLRYNDKLNIKLSIKGLIKYRRIGSMILITLVENAFKYGDLWDSKHPLIINLEVTSEQLVFSIKNKKRKKHFLEESSGGLGLKNIINRLELLYQNKHQFSIFESSESFSCKLVIDL